MISRPAPLRTQRDDNDPSAISDRDDLKKSLDKSLIYVAGYVLALIIVGVILFSFPSIRPPNEGIETWVERFGALVGILSLLIDSKLKGASQYLNSAASSLPRGLFQSLSSSYKYIPYCEKSALGFAIAGAITWSYGSVIIYWVSSLVCQYKKPINFELFAPIIETLSINLSAFFWLTYPA